MRVRSFIGARWSRLERIPDGCSALRPRAARVAELLRNRAKAVLRVLVQEALDLLRRALRQHAGDDEREVREKREIQPDLVRLEAQLAVGDLQVETRR